MRVLGKCVCLSLVAVVVVNCGTDGGKVTRSQADALLEACSTEQARSALAEVWENKAYEGGPEATDWDVWVAQQLLSIVKKNAVGSEGKRRALGKWAKSTAAAFWSAPDAIEFLGDSRPDVRMAAAEALLVVFPESGNWAFERLGARR